MTAWLIRRFVKTTEQVDSPAVRAAYGTLGSGVGIGINLLLMVGKFLMGLLTGSLAIMADAINNLADAFGSVVSLVTMRLAQKPMDAEHPFGHGRLEYIGALGVGALVAAMGFTLLKNGVSGILQPAPLQITLPALLLLAGSVVLKLWLFFFYRKLGRDIHSTPLLAASKDSLSDVAATSAVLVSMGLQWAFQWQVDGYMSMLIAFFVLRTGFLICKDTITLLLGEKADPEKANAIREQLLQYDGVLGVHDLVIHDYGPGRCIASIHAEISAKANIVEIHETIDRAEREIAKALGIMLCIHMDPIVTEDAAVNGVRSQMEEFLFHTDSRLTLHDFRLVPGESQINLIFDCVVPGNFQDREGLRQSLNAFAKSLDERHELIVQFDTDFT